MREVDTSGLHSLRSRREVIMGGIGLTAGGIAGGYGVKDSLFKFEGDSHKVDKYFAERGFPDHQITRDRFIELSPHRFNNLLGQEHNLEVNIVNDEDVLAEVYFDSSDELISLEIKDKHSIPGSLNVVEVQHNDLEYQAPIVGTQLNQSTKLDLGRVSGPSYLRLMRTGASQDTTIPHNGISLFSISGDPLYQAISQCTPVMGMRRDNYFNYSYATDMEGQANALTNDILLHYPVEVRESDKGDIALVYWGLYSAEDGGLGRNPIKLYNDFDHRVYDVDIAQVAILNSEFQLTEIAHQEDNRRGSHQMVGDFMSREGVPPFGQVLHSAPNHGLVGRGFETMDGKEIRKVFHPFPVIDLLLEEEERNDMYWGARVVALEENLGEIDRKTALLNSQQPTANFYAISELESRKKFLQDKLELEIT